MARWGVVQGAVTGWMIRTARLASVLALTSAALAGASCYPTPQTPHVMLVDLPRGDPAPFALAAAWDRDCVGYGGYFRPDYLVEFAPKDNGKVSISASRNDTSEVGRTKPIETSSAEYGTPDEAISHAPTVIGAVIEGEAGGACAYLLPDQSLRFRHVSDLYSATEKLGFRRVNLLAVEVME